MGNGIWLVIMIPCSLLFTGIGVYALKTDKPMWFWSGSTVREEEINDISSYNRANGVMWLTYSAFFWLDTFAGLWNELFAGIMLGVICIIGIPILIVVYQKIYKKYQV